MLIDDNNYPQGNKAMASVLLLYYHLIMDGGFTYSQNAYVDAQEFDGFSFLDVKAEEFHVSGIDELLLREGAVIYLICEVYDLVSLYPEDYLKYELIKKVINIFYEGKLSCIPEVSDLIECISSSELDYEKYNNILDYIFKKYVLGKFKSVVSQVGGA